MSNLISKSGLLESLIHCKELGRRSCEAVANVIKEEPSTSEKEIRDKTIREFAQKIKDWQDDIYDNERNPMVYDFVFDRIYEIAEQMKGGING